MTSPGFNTQTTGSQARRQLDQSTAVTRGIEHGIVLGCPRSGTTFLMRVLNTLPDAECVSGMLLPVAIPHIVNQPLAPEIYEALAVGFERALYGHLHGGLYLSRTAALKKWLDARTGLSGFINAFRIQRRERQIIFKEPFLSLAPEFVDKALPDARIVHIFRDGRDCANSLVRSYDVLTDENLTHLRGSEMHLGRTYDHRYVPWWVEEGRDDEFIACSPYVRAIWMWKYMVRRCHDFFSQPEVAASGRVLLLRYEDLMHNPVSLGRTVAEHLGRTPTKTYFKQAQKAHTGSIGAFKKRDAREIAAAEAIAGDELRLYGYL